MHRHQIQFLSRNTFNIIKAILRDTGTFYSIKLKSSWSYSLLTARGSRYWLFLAPGSKISSFATLRRNDSHKKNE